MSCAVVEVRKRQRSCRDNCLPKCNFETRETVEALKTIVAEQQKQIAQLLAGVKEQTTQIRQVNEQLATTRPTARVLASE